MTRNAGVLNDAFDLERVEILRGPQGTLFGRNNLAGTINMVSARPTEEAGGKIKVALGDNGLRTLRGVVNSGAFADGMMRAKIAAVTRDYDGYYKNAFTGTDLGDTEVDGVRATLAFENGRFDATLIVDHEQEYVIGPGSNNEPLDPGGHRIRRQEVQPQSGCGRLLGLGDLRRHPGVQLRNGGRHLYLGGQHQRHRVFDVWRL